MSLHNQLLKQADHLAAKEPRKPTQASQPRSISASYYALFHRLVDEATRMMISSAKRSGLRQCLSRSFHHSHMKQMCTSLAGGTPPRKLAPAFDPLLLDLRLVSIARTFIDPQEARHQADYNTYRPFTRREAHYFHRLASNALADWNAIRKTPQGDAFLAGLLINQHVQG